MRSKRHKRRRFIFIALLILIGSPIMGWEVASFLFPYNPADEKVISEKDREYDRYMRAVKLDEEREANIQQAIKNGGMPN